MAEDRRVYCSEKTNRSGAHERIWAIGGVHGGITWHYSQEDVIANIEQGVRTYYVEQPPGHRVPVIIARREGHKYLKTVNDGEHPNNLLSLPNCSEPRR